MTKITADHLGRGAFVYIRQSTADQILHNPESRRRQYGLSDRARQLGWTNSRSSTMIWAGQEVASNDRASSGY
jgi:DNA invertase Pin-like site-specific DNA recombinase